MNKIAQYLNEHILGEVTTDAAVRKAFAKDASLLEITPDIIAYPRVTNDIRKIARFSWQLAEKGHTLPLTIRGGGTDQTGAAIGKGLIVNTTAHMNTIFEVDAKQRLVRVQPGVMFKTLNDALALQGLQIPSYPASAAYSTIGGAIANNASGILSGKYGGTASWVQQVEVVLANGDVLQTGRISKRELNRKKGLQTLEGEIYRQIDGLITDNIDLINEKIKYDVRDNTGYGGIADVKRKDGSFDLAPLFAGSQGTLGIVSEVIMKADLLSASQTAVLAAFESYEDARDAVDVVVPTNPSLLEVIDGELFKKATARGKKYGFQTATDGKVGAVIVFAYDEPAERTRKKRVKKVAKLLKEKSTEFVVSTDELSRLEILAVRDVSHVATQPDDDKVALPPLFDGFFVPTDRFEDFSNAVAKLADKYHIKLPIYGHALEGIYYMRPEFELGKVTERQKVFKLLNDVATLIAAHDGHLAAEAGEGRLLAPFTHKQLDDDVKQLYADIKKAFDPSGILNPGVKQVGELKPLVAALRSEYSLAAFANYSLTN